MLHLQANCRNIIHSIFCRKDKRKKEKDSAENISGPMLLEQYVAIADYKKQNRNEVNMVAGDIVGVIDKNENGKFPVWDVKLKSKLGP